MKLFDIAVVILCGIYLGFMTFFFFIVCFCLLVFYEGVVFMGFWFLVLRLALVLFVLGVEAIAFVRLIDCIKNM
mgnify:CR=1 FL=1